MPHYAAFHQGIYCLLRYKRSSDKKYIFLNNYNLTPLGMYDISDHGTKMCFPWVVMLRKQKLHLKMTSAEVICCIYLLTLLTDVSIQANRVDPDKTLPHQEQSNLGLHCLWKGPLKDSRRQQIQMFLLRLTL